MWLSPVIGDVQFGHLIKMVSADFGPSWITIFYPVALAFPDDLT